MVLEVLVVLIVFHGTGSYCNDTIDHDRRTGSYCNSTIDHVRRTGSYCNDAIAPWHGIIGPLRPFTSVGCLPSSTGVIDPLRWWQSSS